MAFRRMFVVRAFFGGKLRNTNFRLKAVLRTLKF